MKTEQAVKLASEEEGLDKPSLAALARVFDPPLTRQAVQLWGEEVPELRALQLEKIKPHWFTAKGELRRSVKAVG